MSPSPLPSAHSYCSVQAEEALYCKFELSWRRNCTSSIQTQHLYSVLGQQHLKVSVIIERYGLLLFGYLACSRPRESLETSGLAQTALPSGYCMLHIIRCWPAHEPSSWKKNSLWELCQCTISPETYQLPCQRLWNRLPTCYSVKHNRFWYYVVRHRFYSERNQLVEVTMLISYSSWNISTDPVKENEIIANVLFSEGFWTYLFILHPYSMRSRFKTSLFFYIFSLAAFPPRLSCLSLLHCQIW